MRQQPSFGMCSFHPFTFFLLMISKGGCPGGRTSSVGPIDKALVDEITMDIDQMGDECDTCLDVSLVLQVSVKKE